MQDFLHFNMANCDIFFMFKTFADVECALIEPRKKKIVCGEKHFNQSDLNINFLNSAWFTTLVRSEGFKVSGHFRLQPCGEGLKDRKLIWINDFEKHGYTRRAQILINKEKDEN